MIRRKRLGSVLKTSTFTTHTLQLPKCRQKFEKFVQKLLLQSGTYHGKYTRKIFLVNRSIWLNLHHNIALQRTHILQRHKSLLHYSTMLGTYTMTCHKIKTRTSKEKHINIGNCQRLLQCKVDLTVSQKLEQNCFALK